MLARAAVPIVTNERSAYAPPPRSLAHTRTHIHTRTHASCRLRVSPLWQAPLERFTSEADVIAKANAPEVGLAAYFYTRDHSRVWRVADGGLVATLAGHRGGVSDCAWSAGSDYLATASDDKTLGLWDARTGKLLRQLTGHTAFVFCCNFNAHSNQLARPPPQSAARGLPRVLRSQPGRL